MNLSQKELKTIQNADFFSIKKQVFNKILLELNELRDHIKASKTFQSFDFPKEMDIEYGKVSKGENYNGLPWIVLDFPRIFNKNGIFAFRTMFLWGKGFFFTLHLSGKYLKKYKEFVSSKIPLLQQHQVYFYQDATDEWQHEVILPFYQELDQMTIETVNNWLQKQIYCKFARKLELSAFQALPTFGLETFELFFANSLNKN